jgi:hypothetical protein
MSYAAQRLDVSHYQLTRDQRVFAEIRMATKMWPCLGTISEGCGSTPEHFPRLELEGKSWRFLRELSNPKDFHPNHRVWASEDDCEKISAQCPPGKICTLSYQGNEYVLHSDARFSFKFRLLRGQDVLAAFRETTKFWTFSVKKNYGIEVSEGLDPMLLSFAFFISVCRTY